MILPHLHLGARDAPFGRIEIDLGPLSGTQLSRANKHQRRKFERESGVGMPAIGVDRAQKFGRLRRLSNDRIVRFRDR